MNSSEPDRSHCSRVSSSLNERNVVFFETTGRTLVYPLSCTPLTFQKNIILTTLLNNTLISLPPGLGKLYIAAIITFNFHRWFLNSKILILSQTRSYLTDLINALCDYTSLSKNSYCELPVNADPKDYKSACEKPILLTSPQKLVELLNGSTFKIENVVLLVIFETSKITKNEEYKKILERLKEYSYRLLLFVEPTGFNPKTLRQVVQEFNISKFEVKNCDSTDIKDCTYRSKIDLLAVDISPHISSIKDTFYAVYEKYAKKLKDAKALSGNVATLTRAQIQKAKERFKKSSPSNMPQAEKDDLIDSMTICAFLCHGIDLLHNWGVGVFYSYLFDEEKEVDLKTLIVKDKDLVQQMKKLNEYLKENGKRIDSSLRLIAHPKLLHLKKIVTQRFEKSETDVGQVRIVILCSICEVVDEIDRVFRSLPDAIRYHCIKTNAKCLANEPEHKEIVKNFLDGVISVLVLSNLVDEVLEIKASLIISLDPLKALLRSSDLRLSEGTPECLFIMTKGNEETKFREMWNEKQNEHKPLEVNSVEVFLQESPRLFPEDFDPEFEQSGITDPKKNFKNSPAQKTLHLYFQSSQNDGSPSLFDKTDACFRKSKTPKKREKIFDFLDSPLLFGDTSVKSSTTRESHTEHLLHDDDFHTINNDYTVELPIENGHMQNSNVKFDDDSIDDRMLNFSETRCLKTVTSATKSISNKHQQSSEIKFDDDSGDELILEFSDLIRSKTVTPKRKPDIPENRTSAKSPIIEHAKKFSWTKKSITPRKLDSSCKESVIKTPAYQEQSDDDEIFPANKILTVAEIHRSPYERDELVKNEETMKWKNETFIDTVFDDDSSAEDKQNCQNGTTESSSFWNRIDLDKIEVERTSEEKVTKVNALGSFVDDLFAEDFEQTAKNDSSKILDFDSDSDIIPDSPKAKQSSKIFSNRSIELENITRSQVSQKDVSQNSKPSMYGDLFPNTVSTATSNSLTSSIDQNTFSDFIRSKTDATVMDTFNEISSDFLKGGKDRPSSSISPSIVAGSFSSRETPKNKKLSITSSVKSYEVSLRCNDSRRCEMARESLAARNASSSGFVSTSVRTEGEPPAVDGSVSPVLSSAKKSCRDRSRLSSSFNQSSSIKFESTFDLSENHLRRLDEIAAERSKPSTPTNLFDSLLDDDDVFDNISDIERAAVSKCRSVSKDSGFTNGSKLLGNCSSSTPKRLNGDVMCKTPEARIIGSNDSTPDEIFLEGYSTPEAVRTNGMRNERSTNQSPTMRSRSKNAQTSRSIDFSNSSLSFGNFTLNGIKEKSAVFSSDTTTSADRTSGLKTEHSTMERLNKMNNRKTDESSDASLINNSNSRFSVFKSRSTSLFRETIRQRLENKNRKISSSSPVHDTRNLIDSDEEFAFEPSPINVPRFKKPEPLVTKKHSVSRHSTPLTTRNSDCEVWSNSPTPEAPAKKNRPSGKRNKLKRKLAEQFIDKEAEVSGEEGEDDDEDWANASQYSVDSFIDDEVTTKPSNMTAYLKSLKSPENDVGKFRIPVLSNSRLKINVCSQVDDYEQSYENDSFCVDEESESEANEYVPSVLTQAEIKLKKQSKNANKRNAYRRIRMIQDSSPDSPQVCKKRTNKRSRRIVSSDSDAD